jgi:hypothetical protein
MVIRRGWTASAAPDGTLLIRLDPDSREPMPNRAN